MRLGLAGLLGLPLASEAQSGEASSSWPAAEGQQPPADQRPSAAAGLRCHNSGLPLPPPAALGRTLSGVPCPPSPTKPSAGDGLARQLSGRPTAATAAVGGEAAGGRKKRKRAAQPAAEQAAAADEEAAAEGDPDEAERKRQARLKRNRETAAASRCRGRPAASAAATLQHNASILLHSTLAHHPPAFPLPCFPPHAGSAAWTASPSWRHAWRSWRVCWASTASRWGPAHGMAPGWPGGPSTVSGTAKWHQGYCPWDSCAHPQQFALIWVLNQRGLCPLPFAQVPEPVEAPKPEPSAAAAAPAAAPFAPLPAPMPPQHYASLPANFSLAAAPAPLPRQSSLPALGWGAGTVPPAFQLPPAAAAALPAAAAAAAAGMSTPPGQLQQPLAPPAAPVVPSTRQALPVAPPPPAQLDPPSATSGVLPWLQPAEPPATLPAPPPADGQAAEAASRAAAAAATVAAMGPEQKAAFLARLQQLHPGVLQQLEEQRSAQGHTAAVGGGGGAGAAGLSEAAAAVPVAAAAPALKQEAAEAEASPPAPAPAAADSPHLPLLEFGSPLPIALGTGPVAPLSAGTLATLLGSPPSPLLLIF